LDDRKGIWPVKILLQQYPTSITYQWAVMLGSWGSNRRLGSSNGNLPLGLWLLATCRLTVKYRISSGTLRSFPVWDYLYLYLYFQQYREALLYRPSRDLA